MDMIGIESVKEKFLAIKGKVDISIWVWAIDTFLFGIWLREPGSLR
jgi:hypothetical protein